MNRFLERNLPPGYRYKNELALSLAVFISGALNSILGYFREYSAARRSLYIFMVADSILDESRVMPDFIHILGDRLNILFILAALAFIIPSAIHYAYHHTGSKSIYLMRRLPKRSELHRRCLLIPLIYALVYVFVAAALLLIYYAVYIHRTPQACLTPNQWQKIWREFCD